MGIYCDTDSHPLVDGLHKLGYTGVEILTKPYYFVSDQTKSDTYMGYKLNEAKRWVKNKLTEKHNSDQWNLLSEFVKSDFIRGIQLGYGDSSKNIDLVWTSADYKYSLVKIKGGVIWCGRGSFEYRRGYFELYENITQSSIVRANNRISSFPKLLEEKTYRYNTELRKLITKTIREHEQEEK